MRSALGPCSNDDRMSLCLAAAVKRRRRTKTRQARTCSPFLPTASGQLLFLLLPWLLAPCSCCCYRAPPLSSPIVYRLSPRLSALRVRCYAVTLSPSTHLLACFTCIRLPNSHPPSRHGASLSFPLSVQPKHTPPQHLVLLTHSLPSTCPFALSDSNLKVHSTAASIGARLSACRASSTASSSSSFLSPTTTQPSRPP